MTVILVQAVLTSGVDVFEPVCLSRVLSFSIQLTFYPLLSRLNLGRQFYSYLKLGSLKTKSQLVEKERKNRRRRCLLTLHQAPQTRRQARGRQLTPLVLHRRGTSTGSQFLLSLSHRFHACPFALPLRCQGILPILSCGRHDIYKIGTTIYEAIVEVSTSILVR